MLRYSAVRKSGQCCIAVRCIAMRYIQYCALLCCKLLAKGQLAVTAGRPRAVGVTPRLCELANAIGGLALQDGQGIAKQKDTNVVVRPHGDPADVPGGFL
jgi:hypothetical protein